MHRRFGLYMGKRPPKWPSRSNVSSWSCRAWNLGTFICLQLFSVLKSLGIKKKKLNFEKGAWGAFGIFVPKAPWGLCSKFSFLLLILWNFKIEQSCKQIKVPKFYALPEQLETFDLKGHLGGLFPL